jgi:hypothetical protein
MPSTAQAEVVVLRLLDDEHTDGRFRYRRWMMSVSLLRNGRQTWRCSLRARVVSDHRRSDREQLMSDERHLVVASTVARARWQNDRLGVVRASHALLRRQAQQQDLHLLGEPTQVVEVLPGKAWVRITLRVEATPVSSVAPPAQTSTSHQDDDSRS